MTKRNIVIGTLIANNGRNYYKMVNWTNFFKRYAAFKTKARHRASTSTIKRCLAKLSKNLDRPHDEF